MQLPTRKTNHGFSMFCQLRIHCYLQYILKVRMLTVAYVGMKKTIKIWSKMMSEFMRNVVKSKVEMCMLFWTRFYWFFVDFGIFLESKWCPKSHWNLRRKTEAGTWTRKLRGTMYVISLVVRVRHYTDHVAPPESQQFNRSGTGGCTNHWKTCISGKSW